MAITVEQVHAATGCPIDAIAANWPLLVAALAEFGMPEDAPQIAMAATVATEPPRFRPQRELHADPERQPELFKLQARYWETGYYGRGFIQHTWCDNYQKLTHALGVDLVNQPDLLLVPAVSARAAAWFFSDHGIGNAAKAGDWKAVRQRVNGGLTGWDTFKPIVDKLLKGDA